MTRQHFIRTAILALTVSCGLTSCFWGDEPTSYKRLTKDFWLNWWADSKDQHILLSMESNGNGGSMVVKQTVFAVGYNDNFIIAKQHPDKEEEISERLFRDQNKKGDFEIKNLADTVYLSKDDRIYQDSGKWFHISNGWSPPDSLKPYKRQIFYHIIDIRNYKRQKRYDGAQTYTVYSFDNKEDFDNKRKELDVPDNLSFTIVDQNLQ